MLLREAAWRNQRRGQQTPPAEPWYLWLVLGGRGSGKTLTGSRWLVSQALRFGGEWGVIAPTWRDVRRVCIEGPSGILEALGPDGYTAYNRSDGDVVLLNGAVIHGDGGEGATG